MSKYILLYAKKGEKGAKKSLRANMMEHQLDNPTCSLCAAEGVDWATVRIVRANSVSKSGIYEVIDE
jgi:hypothetical protein